MTDNTLRQAHDRFFRHSFGHPEVSEPFFQRYLPPEVSERLDFSSLRPEQDSFVDPQLADHRTDLLFSLRQHDGTPARIYLLLEHKSYDAPWVGLQLLDYLVRIWMREQQAPDTPPLPPILGMVLYHGEESWSGGSRFAPLVAAPGPLAAFTPDFRFVLCDLCREQLDGLQQRARLAIALQVLKFIRSNELPVRLPEIFSLFQQLADHRDNVLAYLSTVVRYIAAVAGQVDRWTLEAAIAKALPVDLGENIMPTIAETWKQEGRQEGRQEGLQEHACLVLGKLLRQRFGPLSGEIERRIKAADQATLDDWFDRALTAKSLEGVFSGG